MVLCARFVLAILSKSQRNFLVEQYLKCSAVSIAASEVGDFLCDVSACFLSRKKKGKRGPQSSADLLVLQFLPVNGQEMIILFCYINTEVI